ncbi:TonB-dependent receptor [Exilibacterium tricleocarpae]|uniref:TonB-dependent receptor n=1 Tax=Exilibacterium tricleocarpae TaxID=2591008 RepID=A0A545T0H6_9GAMM|nr:TonB-dependent receptor [Exilibacterium tricleocarpae]TQV70722.1 TonB-dependent receptor [Exilibacterium tricleocarpae]
MKAPITPTRHSAVTCLLTLATLNPLAAAIAQQSGSNETIDEVIVVGTAGGAGINKQDVSFAVSTLNPEQIERFAPKSTADLFKSIPGVWAESSGGVAGANIDVRGLPGGGDAPFVTLTINGAPIYGTESLSFFEQSSIFRIDETIASVEGLRGGPGAVFGKGEPGLTVNFNLKRGGEETEGRIKYTTSDYDLRRFDGVLSGKLAEDTYYMIGGYVQQSPGIRDAEFTSEKGEQFTINLTREFDRGVINVFTRVTDDHGQWYLPFSLNAGLDEGEFSQLGNATRQREIQINANGDTRVFDFARGRGWDGSVSGADIEFEFGDGWVLRDRLGLTTGDANTFGFVPAGSAIRASALSAQIAGPVTTQGGETLADDDFVQTYGHWVVLKEIRSFVNDLSLSKTFADQHDVTFGLYQSDFSVDDFWSLGNPVAVHNTANGDFLDPAITPDDIAAAGGDAGFGFGLAAVGDARTTAFYLADSWQVNDDWRVDLGIRWEEIEITYSADTSNDGEGFPDGTRDINTKIEDDQIAYTAGVNWDVNDNTGIFARYSKGFLFPSFDNVRENQLEVNDIDQYELGVKYGSERFDVFATAFFNTNDSFDSVVGGNATASAFETEAMGLEIDAVTEFGPVRVTLSGVVQDTEVTESTIASNVGNTVLRQPDFQFRLEPSYDFTVGEFNGTLYAAATFVDDRFGDLDNEVDLPSYEKYDLGLQLQAESGIFFQLHMDNVSDSDGITEGDPRNPASPNGRPILGRSLRLSIGYDFSAL